MSKRTEKPKNAQGKSKSKLPSPSVRSARMLRFLELVAQGVPSQEAMRRAGYSESYTKTGGLYKTEGFQAIYNKTFNPKYLSRFQKKLLNRKEIKTITVPEILEEKQVKEFVRKSSGSLIYYVVDEKRKKTRIYIAFLDVQAVSKSLDQLHRIGGRYNDRLELDGNVSSLSPEELERRKAELESELQLLTKRYKEYMEHSDDGEE